MMSVMAVMFSEVIFALAGLTLPMEFKNVYRALKMEDRV
jgi:hypothetical protein